MVSFLVSLGMLIQIMHASGLVVTQGDIRMNKIAMAGNSADMLTKPIPVLKFKSSL